MENIQISEIKKMIENIAWHIENNRYVLGDTKTLDQVHDSLNNTAAYLERKQKVER